MSFSHTTIYQVVSVGVVHYSVINHYSHLKTQLNRFHKSFLLPTTSIEIKYHQEIQFLFKLWPTLWNWSIGELTIKTYQQTFSFVDLQIWKFINKIIENIDSSCFRILNCSRIYWSKAIPEFYISKLYNLKTKTVYSKICIIYYCKKRYMLMHKNIIP
eukprot:69731_1